MSMTGSGLSALLQTNIKAAFTTVDDDRLKKICDAIGDSIVDYIQANATVPAGIAVSTSGGDGATSAPGMVE